MEKYRIDQNKGIEFGLFTLGEHTPDPHTGERISAEQCIHEIIEKILYQHEMFGHQRYLAQLDFGGVPFDKVMKNIELIGTGILPAVKKYTAK